MSGLPLNREYSFTDFWNSGKGVRSCCTFHGLIYRTGFYRACGIKLTEHVFYEDLEYAVLPFRNAPVVLPLDFLLDEYTMGNEGQSVSGFNQVRNLSHLEKIFWKIRETYSAFQAGKRGVPPRAVPDSGKEPAAVRGYFRYKLTEILFEYFTIALLKNPDRKSGRDAAVSLWRRVKERDPELARHAMGKYILVFTLRWTGFRNWWGTLRRFPGYNCLRGLVR
jgi:hypothetical protein